MARGSRKQAVEEIRRGSRLLVRELDVVNGVYLGTGYTLTQCHVLFELASHGRLGLMELAQNLLTDKSNTSRTVKKLIELGLVESEKSLNDNRQKFFSLTFAGEEALKRTIHLADEQVESALEFLSPDEQAQVVNGLALYAKALRYSREQSAFEIRKIQSKDNTQIARVIRAVMSEFDAIGQGYSEADSEVDDIAGNYRNKQSCYYVIEQADKIVGGGGLAPLAGGSPSTCELRKMFFLPKVRGIGLGRKLLEMLVNEARKRNYADCYIETLDRMQAAKSLYEGFGFERLEAPIGETGHSKTDVWYLLQL